MQSISREKQWRTFKISRKKSKTYDKNKKNVKPKEISPGGGMVDAVDSKSAVSNGVRVQVPPGVQKGFQFWNPFFLPSYSPKTKTRL